MHLPTLRSRDLQYARHPDERLAGDPDDEAEGDQITGGRHRPHRPAGRPSLSLL
jgi:hypothetical protein